MWVVYNQITTWPDGLFLLILQENLYETTTEYVAPHKGGRSRQG